MPQLGKGIRSLHARNQGGAGLHFQSGIHFGREFLNSLAYGVQ